MERLRINGIHLRDHSDGPGHRPGKSRALEGVGPPGLRRVLEGCRMETGGLGREDGGGKVLITRAVEFNGQEPGLAFFEGTHC
ncbi:hypothetical protein D3C73_1543440 [compost metagenome]